MVCAVLDAASGEDLVPEQTRQREEDKQEEAAKFPAGHHDDTSVSRLQRLHQRPRRPQPPPHHAVRHSIGRVLGGFSGASGLRPHGRVCGVFYCQRTNEEFSHLLDILIHFLSSSFFIFFCCEWELFFSSPIRIFVSHSTSSYFWFIRTSAQLLISYFFTIDECN